MKKKIAEKRFNKKTKFKKNQLLRDRWYYERGCGSVIEVLKTRIKIRFVGETVTYDRDHYQFLVGA